MQVVLENTLSKISNTEAWNGPQRVKQVKEINLYILRRLLCGPPNWLNEYATDEVYSTAWNMYALNKWMNGFNLTNTAAQATD